jgi:hypothetical protein
MGSRKVAPGLIAGACWLALPTALGSTVWPVLLPGLVSVLTFLISSTILLRSRQLVPGNYWVSVVLYLFSILTYEASYFQFIPLIVLVWLLRPRTPRKQVLWCFAFFAGAQAAGVAWNRAVSVYVRSAISKPFAADWPLIFVGSFSHLPHELYQAFNEVAYPLIIVVTLLLAVLWIHWKSHGQTWLCSSPLSVATIAGFGCVLSALVYAFAGYGLIGTGVFSEPLSSSTCGPAPVLARCSVQMGSAKDCVVWRLFCVC